MMSETIKFSIITVTLNNLSDLQKTAASIQSQTSTNYEWIVIDGSSTDGTLEFLKETKATFISEPDHGIYDAMNKGLEHAKGDYLLFLNAGDTLAAPETLQIIAKHTKDNPDLIYGDAHENSHYKKARPHTKIAQGMFTHHQSMLYAYRKINTLRYDLNHKISADYDFTLRFLKNAEKITYIPQPICVFQSGGFSQTNVRTGRKEQFKIRKKHKTCSNFENILIATAQTINWNIRRFFPALYWLTKQ